MSSTANGAKPQGDNSVDLLLAQQVAKLQQLAVWRRWLSLGFLWLTLGWWSLWELRESIVLLREYFSWAGVIYGFYFHLVPGCGLLACLIFSWSSIFWQISHSFGSLSARERHQLEMKVHQIQAVGTKHWLWNWIQIK
jgi:hypothetical protein